VSFFYHCLDVKVCSMPMVLNHELSSWLYSHCFVHLQFFLNLSHADKTMEESFSIDFSLNDFFVLFSPERKRVLFKVLICLKAINRDRRLIKIYYMKKFEMIFHVRESFFSSFASLFFPHSPKPYFPIATL
jgi:hypothetical protein